MIPVFRKRRAHIVLAHGQPIDVDYGKGYAEDKYVEWGSITKLVTAQAVVRLADDGDLDLDAPVAAALGFLPTSVTARGLLTHTSGLARVHRGMKAGVFSDPYADVTEEVLLGYLTTVGEEDLIGPGQMTYSNLGYAVLGMLMEKVTGQPWFDVVSERVLSRWDLTRVIPLPPVEARVHIKGFDRQPHQPWSLASSSYAAAGALWSPLADLADYGRRVLTEGGYRHPERGWQTTGRRWWHNGQTRDSGSCLILLPDLSVVVAAHALAALPGAADRLADRLAGAQEDLAA